MIINLREIQVVWINLDSAVENFKTMQERLGKNGFKFTFSVFILDKQNFGI